MSTETQQVAAPDAAPKAATPVSQAPAAQEAVAAVEATEAVEAAETAAPDAGAGAETQNIEDGVAALSIAQPQAELHRACTEGRLEDVRAILAQGLEALETLDPVTAMTPIVLAIQNGHADVVRELLTAGAIVPPPGVTGDPVMLSILYPQPMYGVPPPFAQMGPPQFYPPQGFYPPVRTQNGSAPNGASPNGVSPNGAANLPPAEVAKTIPCRNFPCKYGASCMFLHTRPQNPNFFPGPYGYEGFVPYPGAVPFFPGQEFVPASASQTPVEGENAPASADGVANGENASAAPTTPHDSIPAGSHVPSPIAPAFIPMRPDGQAPYGAAGFPMGAMSPTLTPMSPSHMPSDPAFFATSPPFQPFVPNGYPGHGRRTSFGQFSPNGGPPKPYHGKKPSFSGGSKPWGPGGRSGSSHLGTWKDGNPPPCAFFREGKCRNHEFCKFPHIDADGNDVRHPDVIRGIIPPAPTRPTRGMRMMGAHYDPRHQPYVQTKQNGASPPVVEAAEGDNVAVPASADKEVVSAPSSAAATLPPKPSNSAPPSRSTSQPGNPRVNGVHSRSHSPNGHGARRGPRYANGQANGSRSSSAHDKKAVPPQRIPRADEFPALGLSAASTPTTERREPSWGSKTAAQVLSEPAPVKPVSTPTKETEDTIAEVVMDSDSEQDAVIVSVSTTPNPEVAKAKLASAVSFASVAGVVDAAPVALKV